MPAAAAGAHGVGVGQRPVLALQLLQRDVAALVRIDVEHPTPRRRPGENPEVAQRIPINPVGRLLGRDQSGALPRSAHARVLALILRFAYARRDFPAYGRLADARALTSGDIVEDQYREAAGNE
jgi:hypothetical protein